MRDLRWVAQHADGRIIREWEFAGSWAQGRWVENAFWGLDLSQVISFGLEGSHLRIGFSTLDGILGINGKALEMRFVLENGRIFPLTGRRDTLYRAILHWKSAHSDLSPTGAVYQDCRPVQVRVGTSGGIASYSLGWKIGGYDDDLGGWEASLLATVPVDEQRPILGLLRTVTGRGLRGSFEWFVAGHRISAVPTILRPGMQSQIALNFWRAET